MKKTIIIAFLALFSLQLSAQNIVKIAPLKLFNTKLAVGYERVINEKLSFALGLQVVLPNQMNNINDDFKTSFEQSGNFDLENISFDGFRRDLGVKLTPELRFYIAGDAPKGFYLDVFGRFTRTQFAYEDVYITQLGNTVDVNLQNPLTIGALGGGLGTQFFLGESIVVDWNIGLGFGAYLFGLNGEIDAANLEDANEFLREVERGFALDDSFGNLSSNEVNEGIATGFFVLISRLSIGYMF